MLARDGCNVVCIGTPSSDKEKREKPHPSMERIERTVAIINGERQAPVQVPAVGATPGRAVAFGCDIANEDECEDAVQFALDTFGRLDILVNNAGINGLPGTAVDVDMDSWADAMHFNVASMVHMAMYAVPAMQFIGGKTGKTGKTKSGGSIINMSSVTGMAARRGAPAAPDEQERDPGHVQDDGGAF